MVIALVMSQTTGLYEGTIFLMKLYVYSKSDADDADAAQPQNSDLFSERYSQESRGVNVIATCLCIVAVFVFLGAFVMIAFGVMHLM